MDNPVDTSSFTHSLTFESLGHTTPYFVAEPAGFPSIAYTVQQKDDGWARDQSFIASGDKALRFNANAVGEYAFEQVINPQGKVSKYLDHGYEWIKESTRQFGPNAKILYTLYQDDILLDTGYLQCSEPDTDGYTYFGCNVIRDYLIQDYERHSDTKLNLLGTKNVRNEDVAPAPILKFLRRAVPSNSESEFFMSADYFETESFFGNSDALIFQPINQIRIDGIENTNYQFEQSLYIPNSADTSEIQESIDKFRIMTAKRRYTDLKFDLKHLLLNIINAPGFITSQCVVAWGNDPITDWTRVQLFESFDPTVNIDNEDFTYTIPSLEIGQKVWFYFSVTCTFTPAGGTPFATSSIFMGNQAVLNISGTSTSLDTVVNGIRRIDAMKKCSRDIRDVPVNAPDWDVDGEHYDNVIYNRSSISQNTEIPFTTTYEDCFDTQEECGDFENKKDEIFVGPFEAYHENQEIGVFRMTANSGSRMGWNKFTKVNSLRFGYDKYQDDSNTGQDTLEDPHTEAEWIVQNEAGQDVLERKFPYVRSGYAAQKAADLEISKPTTADSTDDDVYQNSIIPLPEGSFNEFGAILTLQIVNGKLKIANKSNDVDEDNVVINWLTTGAIVGQLFYITDGANVDTYTVTEITREVITLDPTGTPTESGDQYVKVKFFYVGVEYQTAGAQGFDIVENITNPTNYPNLRYTIRDAIQRWGSVINTACAFIQDALILNTYFKNNGKLRTQFMGGSIYVQEADIATSELADRILSGRTFDLELECSYAEAVQYLNNYKTVRGFVRAYDAGDELFKGFIGPSFEYYFADRKLVVTMDEKFEPRITELIYSGGVLSVNGTDYEVGGTTQWWEVDNGYFKAYDLKSRPLTNWKFYDEVSLNGVIYASAGELVDALSLLG